ncbi:hypothetical protein Nepgr_007839 [Nepenthes gracilis]|uniref:Uncharacterized protein n=1 Tax=Nepenthes gracilis TaxID=150966 RepID=A0AAD3XIQ0_NEPGR|nr:hypothetical protein Nepgr_007839 [Nepenthes gracilis]
MKMQLMNDNREAHGLIVALMLLSSHYAPAEGWRYPDAVRSHVPLQFLIWTKMPPEISLVSIFQWGSSADHFTRGVLAVISGTVVCALVLLLYGLGSSFRIECNYVSTMRSLSLYVVSANLKAPLDARGLSDEPPPRWMPDAVDMGDSLPANQWMVQGIFYAAAGMFAGITAGAYSFLLMTIDEGLLYYAAVGLLFIDFGILYPVLKPLVSCCSSLLRPVLPMPMLWWLVGGSSALFLISTAVGRKLGLSGVLMAVLLGQLLWALLLHYCCRSHGCCIRF